MDTEKAPIAETIPVPKKGEIPAEGGGEEYIKTLSLDEKVEQSKERTFLRFFSLLEYVFPLGAITLVGVVLFGVSIALLIWGFNLLAPEDWRWLEDDRINRLQVILFSGISGAMLNHFLRWYFNKVNNQKD